MLLSYHSPLQNGSMKDHIAFGKHSLVSGPIKANPGAQE